MNSKIVQNGPKMLIDHGGGDFAPVDVLGLGSAMKEAHRALQTQQLFDALQVVSLGRAREGPW